MWVSSMTGGTEGAGTINRNLARACKEFGFGMGLGSCRTLLDSDAFLPDFDIRETIGEDLPMFANLGICQVEQLIEKNQTDKIIHLMERLRADGLIIHVNPMQEWFQTEGDFMQHPPIDTIKRLLDKIPYPLIVKEVGQGMGPASLKELFKLPLAAVEFAAFGGTNFARVELLRAPHTSKDMLEPLTRVGADAPEMVETVNKLFNSERKLGCKQIIISGGIQSFLDGYYLLQKSLLPAVFGQASAFLNYARQDYEQLQTYISKQIKGLEMASAYLRIKQ